MIFVTGDCHGDFYRFKRKAFKEQTELDKSDIMIICGDFGGIWEQEEDGAEKYWLDFLDNKKYTTVFVCGNHENFDRLSRYEVVDFHGGKAHKIRESVYHLMRGEVYDFDGKTFFAFGGASSHDIDDGVLDPADFESPRELRKRVKKLEKQGKMIRVLNESWWAQELPSREEYDNALRNLERVGYKVDYVISHCAPQSVVDKLFEKVESEAVLGEYVCPMPAPDELTAWFDELLTKLEFKHWYFGHYHKNMDIGERFTVLYQSIEKVE